MKLLAALQKEARKLEKTKTSLERQLKAISAAVKAFGTTLVDSANRRKKRKPRMSAAGRAAISRAQKARWAKAKKAR